MSRTFILGPNELDLANQIQYILQKVKHMQGVCVCACVYE